MSVSFLATASPETSSRRPCRYPVLQAHHQCFQRNRACNGRRPLPGTCAGSPISHGSPCAGVNSACHPRCQIHPETNRRDQQNHVGTEHALSSGRTVRACTGVVGITTSVTTASRQPIATAISTRSRNEQHLDLRPAKLRHPRQSNAVYHVSCGCV